MILRFDEQMRQDRIVIVGVPRAGKTTLATSLSEALGLPVLHTDDLIEEGWDGASELVSEWFDGTSPAIIEGMAVPRALRKWLRRNEHTILRPFTVSMALWEAREALTDEQERMGEQAEAVWRETQSTFADRRSREEVDA